MPLLAVCGYFTLIHVLTFAEVRHSEPLHPILAVVIATAAGELQRRLKSSVISHQSLVISHVLLSPLALGQTSNVQRQHSSVIKNHNYKFSYRHFNRPDP